LNKIDGGLNTLLTALFARASDTCRRPSLRSAKLPPTKGTLNKIIALNKIEVWHLDKTAMILN
jgi:hypothetical protein